MKSYTKLINRLTVCAGLLFSSAIAGAQTGFIKNYGGSGTDSGRCIEITSDGGYMVAGHTTTNSAGFADLYVLRLAANGDTLWTKKFGGNGVEQGFTIQRVSDGNYIICGYTTSFSNAEQGYLLKIDEGGNKLWEKNFGGAGSEHIEAAYETSDGGIIMVGNTTSAPAVSSDVYLVKTDASGNEQWSKNIGGTGFDYGNVVQPTSDGGYAIIGITYSKGAGNGDYWFIKTDASGNVQWDKTYGGPQVDEGKNIRQTSDGGYIITGDTDSKGAGMSDVWVIKTDASGNMTWEKTYGGNDKDVSKMIEPTTDGGYIIAAISRSFGKVNPDGWIIKTNATGDTLWTRFYGGPEHEHFYSVKATADGGYVAVGHSDSYGQALMEQVFVVKMDGNGLIPTGIEDAPYAIKNMSVYPNPSNGVFEVELDLNGAPWADVKLVNASGQVVLSERIENKTGTFHKKLDLSGFAKGLYMLNVSVNEQQTTKKVMLY